MSLIAAAPHGRQPSRTPRAILPALNAEALKLLSRLAHGPVALHDAEQRSLALLAQRGAARLALGPDGAAVAVRVRP